MWISPLILEEFDEKFHIADNVDIIETLSLKWKNSIHMYFVYYFIYFWHTLWIQCNSMQISPLILEEFDKKSLSLRWDICFQFWFELYRSRMQYY